MELRSVAVNLIVRDATLRTLLANYARRLEGEGAPEYRAEPQFISLSWAVDDRARPRAGSEVLIVDVHVSRDHPCSPAQLDAVLQRLRAALTRTGPNPCLTARCLTTSGAGADSRFGTLTTSSTWAIDPVPAEPERAHPIDLGPWRVWGGPDAPGLLVPGLGVLSMN